MLAFFVIWIPRDWIFEPSTNLNQEDELKALAIDRGAHAVQLFSEENQLGVGCVRCHGPDLTGGIIQAGHVRLPAEPDDRLRRRRPQAMPRSTRSTTSIR